ncbi:hypothetical protein [Buttiauxella gaviniae]|uniref:hypothetical protein n=1 Tax=Buttiauxella gaviniae TaxID=82990 RepID=UPI0039B106C4
MNKIILNKMAVNNLNDFNAYLIRMQKIGISAISATYIFINLYNPVVSSLNLSLIRLVRIDAGKFEAFNDNRNDNIRFLRNNGIRFVMEPINFNTIKLLICHLYENEKQELYNNSLDFYISFVKANDDLFYDNKEDKNKMINLLVNIDKEVLIKNELRDFYYNKRGVYA